MLNYNTFTSIENLNYQKVKIKSLKSLWVSTYSLSSSPWCRLDPSGFALYIVFLFLIFLYCFQAYPMHTKSIMEEQVMLMLL